MHKILIALTAAVGIVTAAASAFAVNNVSCSDVPKAEWAQCIFDQAASGGE